MHTKKEGARANVIKNAITRATIYKNAATTSGATVNGVAKEGDRERERQGQAHLLSVCGYFNYQNVGNAIVAVTAVVVALVAAAAAAAGKTLN